MPQTIFLILRDWELPTPFDVGMHLSSARYLTTALNQIIHSRVKHEVLVAIELKRGEQHGDFILLRSNYRAGL